MRAVRVISSEGRREGILLSVVIPVYNLDGWIQETIGSFSNQPLSRIEFIVVNDGSTDSSGEVAATCLGKLRGTNARLITVDNSGVSAARNEGLREADGKYVLFLDGDDRVASDFSANLVPILNSCSDDVVAWRFERRNRDGRIIPSIEPDPNPGGRMPSETALDYVLRNDGAIWTGSAAYRTAFLHANGLRFTPDCARGEDREFVYKSLAAARWTRFLPVALTYYIQRPGSTTSPKSASQYDSFDAHLRAAHHVERALPERNDLSRLIRKRGLNSFFRNLSRDLEGAAVRGPRSFFESLERHHPILLKRVRREVLAVLVAGLPVSRSMQAFLLSPTLYFLLRKASLTYSVWEHSRARETRRTSDSR